MLAGEQIVAKANRPRILLTGSPVLFPNILPSIAKHNNVVLCRLRSSRQSHYVALAEGV